MCRIIFPATLAVPYGGGVKLPYGGARQESE